MDTQPRQSDTECLLFKNGDMAQICVDRTGLKLLIFLTQHPWCPEFVVKIDTILNEYFLIVQYVVLPAFFYLTIL